MNARRGDEVYGRALAAPAGDDAVTGPASGSPTATASHWSTSTTSRPPGGRRAPAAPPPRTAPGAPSRGRPRCSTPRPRA